LHCSPEAPEGSSRNQSQGEESPRRTVKKERAALLRQERKGALFLSVVVPRTAALHGKKIIPSSFSYGHLPEAYHSAEKYSRIGRSKKTERTFGFLDERFFGGTSARFFR
jgi:hypothetical protein